MPEINVDTEQLVSDGVRTINASPDDINQLINSPIFRPSKPEVVSPGIEKFVSQKKVIPVNVNEMIDRMDLGLDLTTKLSGVIMNRARHLRMKVDPIEQEELYAACKAMFKNFKGWVSFKMYESLLSHNRKLLTESANLGGKS